MAGPWQPIAQTPITAVSDFYQNKALRAQTAALELETEQAPSKMFAAIKKAQLDEEKMRLGMEKTRGEITDADLARRKEVYGPILEESKKQLTETGDVDIEWVNSVIPDAVQRMGEKEIKNFRKFTGEDGILDHEEFARFGMAYGYQQESGDRTAQKFIDKNGNPIQGSMDKQGNYYDSSGKQRTDITPIAPAATQADLKTASGRSKNIIDFEDTTIGAVGAVQTGTELLKIAINDPAALGKPGAINTFGNEMMVTAKAIINVAGWKKLKASETNLQDKGAEAFNWDSVDLSKMQLTAVEATAFKAGVFGIAFAAAVAEQGTRPTDKDIQQFIDQIGGRSSDPVAFRRTIVQFMKRQDRRLHTIADVKDIPQAVQDRAFAKWDVAFAEFLAAASATPTAQDSSITEPQSEDEYNALPSGTSYLFNGQIMVKP